MITVVYSYSVWIRPPELTSLSFEGPHFLPTCECPFFTSFQVANRSVVFVSDWQKVISTDSFGKSHFAALPSGSTRR